MAGMASQVIVAIKASQTQRDAQNQTSTLAIYCRGKDPVYTEKVFTLRDTTTHG